MERLHSELYENHTPYNELSKEYQVYQSYIVSALYSAKVLKSDEIDKNDATYIAWTTDETISLYEYLSYAISMNWVDVSKLNMESQYSDSAEIFEQTVRYIDEMLTDNTGFQKKIYKYLLKETRTE